MADEFDSSSDRAGRKPSAHSGAAPATGRRPALEPATAALEVVLAVHRAQLDAMRRSEPGLRSGLDDQPLHAFRVAVRRTRAALSQLRGVLAEGEVARFQADFVWLGRLTGTARDLDVQRLRLGRQRRGLPARLAAELEPLERRVAARRRAEYERIRLGLDSPRYRRLVADWSGFLERRSRPDDSLQTAPAAARPVAEVAAERIERALVRVLKRGRRIGPDSPAAKLHRLRIACKKLRYLLEFFSGLWTPADVEPVIRALRRLQDDLGEFNDCQVQRGDLALDGAGHSTAARAELLGRLERRQLEARRRFERQFAEFDSAEIQGRLGRLLTS